MEEQFDPKQVARFKRHIMVLALCFACVVAMKVYMGRQLERHGAHAGAAEPVGDVALRAYEVEAAKLP